MSLDLEHVSIQYKDSGKITLEDISLHVDDGEFICLLGPSGCGKSTLLKAVAGLEKPISGKILLDGEEIREPGADRVMMFQDSALFPWYNVIENVKFGMKIAKVPAREQEERAMKYLSMVHLNHYAHYRIHQLSGGMKQRVALARALTLDSRVLLMDEPFASLDKQTKNILRDEIQNIWMQTRKTVIFVTHSVEEALFFGDRIVMLTTNPATVKSVTKIDFPRPRDIVAPDFIRVRKGLLDELRSEVEKVAADECKQV